MKQNFLSSAGEKLKTFSVWLSTRPNFVYQLISAALVLALILPFIFFLFYLFRQSGHFSLDAFREAFLSRTSHHLIFETLILIVGSALFAILVGLPLGFFFAATRFPLRRLFLAVLVFPLCVPAYLWAFGWELILGRRGYLEGLLWEGTGDYTSSFLFSLPGSIFVLGLYFSGWVVLSVVAFLMFGIKDFALDPEQPWRKNFFRFLSVYPKSSFSWFSFFLISLMVFRDFGAVSLLGRETFSPEIYSFFSTFYNFDSIAAPGILVLLFALIFWTVWEGMFKNRMLSLAQSQPVERMDVLETGKWQTPLFWILIFAVTAFYFYPVWIFFVKSESLGFYWKALKAGGGSVARTLIFSGLGTVLLVALVLFIDRFIRISKPLVAAIIEKSFAFIFFIPGVLTGVLLNRFWNHRWTAWVYTSFVLVLLGVVTQYLYPMLFGKRLLEKRLNFAREPETDSAGVQTLLKKSLFIFQDVRILSLAMAGLLISLREMGSTVLLYPPGQESLLIKIFTLKPVETEPVMSSLVVLYLILISIPCLVLALRFRKI